MRFTGTLLILAAVALAIWELALSGARVLSPLGEIWFRLHPDSLQLLQPAIERHVSPELWDPWILTLLEAPAALVIGGLGLILLALSGLLRR